MKLIPLSKGKVAIVDDEDYHFLMMFKWHASEQGNSKADYACTKIRTAYKKYKKLWMHRIVTKCPDGLVVDHLNSETLDNRKQNLEVVTLEENSKRKRNIKVYEEIRAYFGG